MASSSHVSPVIIIQENKTRNKRKFRGDGSPSPSPPTGFEKIVSSSLESECLSYDFERLDCDMCSFSDGNVDSVNLDLGGVGGFEVGNDRNRVKLEGSDEFDDIDWSDLTESGLEELLLDNLDAMFKSVVKKVVSYGYSEEDVTMAVLRCGFCYGCKDVVANVVENTLSVLENGREVDLWRERQFDNLKQMEKCILAELVCVIRDARPVFSTGDAMWWLLISDMDVSHACVLDGGALCDGASNGCFSSSVETHLRKEVKSSESLHNPCKPNHNSISESPSKTEVSHSKPKPPFALNGFTSQKGNQSSTSRTISRSFSLSSQNHEDKPVGSRKINGISKRDYILRQKSVRLEKSYRTHGSKGASRAAKLGNIGGLILDKKLKSVSQSTSSSFKSTSYDINNNGATQTGLTSPSLFNIDAKTNIKPLSASTDSPPALSVAEAEFSLSLLEKSNNLPLSEVPNLSFSAVPNEKSFGRWIPQDKKDETIGKLVPRVGELQSQLQEWTEWANQKVMQAARRLGKDKAELKTLRQEKEEVERLKKEKHTLEKNTMKKLTEKENAFMKASNQVGRADGAVCRLKMENANLRLEMEAASLQEAESAASCIEVSKRAKNTLMQLQLREKQKTLFQEELITENRKLGHLQEDLERAKEQRDELETKWKQEEKAKQELINQATKIRIERQEGEVKAKSREDLTRLKADKNLQKYKEDIQKLEKEISLLRIKSDSSKIAALKRGIDGSYASKLTDVKASTSPQTLTRYVPEMVTGNGGVKRERECVMCLSEEKSVVFLPCAHQVVCTKCNELHEKQGMKDCPSCRGPIQRRVCVHYARS